MNVRSLTKCQIKTFHPKDWESAHLFGMYSMWLCNLLNRWHHWWPITKITLMTMISICSVPNIKDEAIHLMYCSYGHIINTNCLSVFEYFRFWQQKCCKVLKLSSDCRGISRGKGRKIFKEVAIHWNLSAWHQCHLLAQLM